MKTYRIIIAQRAQKAAEKLPKKDRERVTAAIALLQYDPFQGKKLQGEHEGKWSVRVWPYRIVYIIKKELVTVTVVKIGHRQGVYER